MKENSKVIKNKEDLYQSAILEELSKNIHQKPMIIDKEEVKHSKEEISENDKKMKVI